MKTKPLASEKTSKSESNIFEEEASKLQYKHRRIYRYFDKMPSYDPGSQLDLDPTSLSCTPCRPQAGKAQQTSTHSSATTAAKGRRHAATAGSTSRLEKYHRKRLTPVRTFIMLIEPPRFSPVNWGLAAPLPPAEPAGIVVAECLSRIERKSLATGGLVLQNGNQAAWRRPVSVFFS